MEPLVDVLWSCIILMKEAQKSPHYEGYEEALQAFAEVEIEVRVRIPPQRDLHDASDNHQSVMNAIHQWQQSNRTSYPTSYPV